MYIKLRVLLIVVVLFYLVILIQLLRKRKLELRYTLLWLLFVLVFILVLIFPSSIYTFADFVGIEVPSNALFTLCICIQFMMMVFLTTIVSKLHSDIKLLVQELALADNRIRALEQERKIIDENGKE